MTRVLAALLALATCTAGERDVRSVKEARELVAAEDVAVALVLAERQARTHSSGILERAYADPLAWVAACAPSADLAPYQADVLARMAPERRVAVRKGRGAGGSATAALTVWWFASTREARGDSWKILTTAGSHEQLSRYLWPEIHLWQRRLNLAPLGLSPSALELLTREIKGTHGQAFARATDDPNLIEGGHAEQLLVVLDEAAAIPDPIWDSVEGMFGSATGTREARALAISKPAEDVGRFFAICSGRVRGWWPRHVRHEEAVAAGRVSPAWAEQMRELWGEDSALYRNHVLAEFAQGGAAGAVIPLWALDAARLRWIELRETAALKELVSSAYGLDVGTGQPGRDPATLATIAGDVVVSFDVLPPALDPRDTEMHLAGILGAKLTRANRGSVRAAIDSNGYGGGTLSRLRELGHDVTGFVASGGSERRTADGEFGFANLRAEALYGIRERLIAPGSKVAIPDEPNLIGELSEPRQKSISSTGKILVESKDEIARRLKRRADRTDEGSSTNRADALVIGMWAQSSAAVLTPAFRSHVATRERERHFRAARAFGRSVA